MQRGCCQDSMLSWSGSKRLQTGWRCATTRFTGVAWCCCCGSRLPGRCGELLARPPRRLNGCWWSGWRGLGDLWGTDQATQCALRLLASWSWTPGCILDGDWGTTSVWFLVPIHTMRRLCGLRSLGLFGRRVHWRATWTAGWSTRRSYCHPARASAPRDPGELSQCIRTGRL